MDATATHAANARASSPTVHRVAGASTAVVTQRGNGRPGVCGSNRGLRQASATTAKVKVRAHAAPIRAYVTGMGRSVDPPSPCARTEEVTAP